MSDVVPKPGWIGRTAAWVRNMSIKRKLVLVIMLTCFTALLLAGIVFVGWEWTSVRRSMVRDLSTHADMLADNLKASVAFEDPKDATEILRALAANPSVVTACMYKEDNRLFAAYFRKGVTATIPSAELRPKGHTFAGGYLTVFKPVYLNTHDTEVIGTLCLRSDLVPMYTALGRSIQVIVGVLLLACLVAYIVSAKLQRLISSPILTLAAVANTVSQKREYSIRADKRTDDEIGSLIDAFNDMLEQIQQRDSALVASNEMLEAGVRERTAELTAANEQLTREIDFRKKTEQLIKDRSKRIIRHQSALLKLGKLSKDILDGMIRATTEEDAQTLHVERVSVWLFGDDPSELICRDLYKVAGSAHESGLVLRVDDYPRYFHATETSRIIAVKDAPNDPQTSEFTEGYLKPNGVTSMMDVPIRLHGRVVGIICHEHTGPPRDWTLEEQDFGASIADMISLQLEAEERRKAEHALEEANKNLAQMVRELKRSNKELQDFAYITAHDLKTPLRAIGTLSDWIATDNADRLTDDGREQLRLLKQRVARMSDLIDSVLRYSEIGRASRRMEKVDLNVLVPEVIAQFAALSNVEIFVDGQLPVVVSEKIRLLQVFQNLIANAIKHTDKPQCTVHIACADEADLWKFSVADNGPGIDSKYFGKIFEMFQTLARRDDIESTGMGLAIVKKIVELYGGAVWVESVVGEGSTFFFTLPKQAVQTDTLRDQVAAAEYAI